MDIQDNPREILKILTDLQTLENRVSSLQKEINSIPEEISRHQNELDQYSLRLENAKENAAATEKDRRTLEGEVESLRQKVAHYKTQLMSVKTNAEYQAMLHEISFVESQVSDREDAILEKMLKSDQLAEELKELGDLYQEKEGAFTAQKRELELQGENDIRELKELKARKMDLEQALPAEYLSRYQRIASARNGQAVAFLVGETCSACHVRLRPQLIAEVKTGKKIVQCENCSRILISG